MTPLAFNLGPTELLIILAIVILLFGGSKLAGLGKSSGRALREFKEETRSLREKEGTTPADATARTTTDPVHPEPLAPTDPGYTQPPSSSQTGAVDPSDARRDV